MLRRTAATALSVLLAGSLVFAGSPAHAVEPPPGPVDELLDIPSRVVKSATGSPVGDTVMMMLKGQRWVAGGGSLVAPPAVPLAEIPKPITAPAAAARAGGSVLTAAMLGWGIGSNGSIALIALANGTDYSQVYCSQPQWYQGVTSFVNMGFSPDCFTDVTNANDDHVASPLVYGGTTFSYLGSVNPVSAPNWRYHCGGYTGTNPTSWPGSYTAIMRTSAGDFSLSFGAWDLGNVCAPAGFTAAKWSLSQTSPASWTGAGTLMVRNNTTGVIVAQESAAGDPTRTARCKITWRDGTTTTGTGQTYKESTGLPMSASGLGCEQAYVSKPGRGPALMPSRIAVESDDGTSITEISGQDVPEFGPDEKRAFETGNGHGLVLEKVTGVTVSSCMTWAADCSGWWTATDEGTTPAVGSSTYRCTYGGAEIALVECGPYRHTFDTQTQTPTITDPVTGEDVEWSAQPSTGNSINPGTGPGTGLSPADACFETGWSEAANPVDWVLVPVKCALVWAFVPRQSVVDAAQGSIQDGIDSSVVGTVGTALASLGSSFDAGVGCGGLPIHLEAFGHTLVDSYLLASCEEPAAGIAATVRTILSVAIIGGGILAFTRYLGSLFGFESFGRNRTESKGGPSFD